MLPNPPHTFEWCSSLNQTSRNLSEEGTSEGASEGALEARKAGAFLEAGHQAVDNAADAAEVAPSCPSKTTSSPHCWFLAMPAASKPCECCGESHHHRVCRSRHGPIRGSNPGAPRRSTLMDVRCRVAVVDSASLISFRPLN
jgi:hypothetical protein